jgi:glycosyltransferase involved in cell wall biosynthesis
VINRKTKYVYFFPAKGAGSLFKHFHIYERWPRLARERGLDITMLGFLSAIDYMRGIDEVRKRTRANHVTVIPTPIGGKIKSGCIVLYFIFLALLYDRVVVHGRKVSAATRLELARHIVGDRIKYVVELESDPVLEAEYAAQADTTSLYYEDTTPEDAKSKQRLTVERADHVITITDELRERLIDRYPELELAEKTTAATVDFPDRVEYDTDARAAIRSQLGAGDRLVYTYIGSAAPVWQNFDRTIEVFSLLANQSEYDPFLLLLVREPDHDFVEQHITDAEISDEDYCLCEVRASEVKQYLHASDIGVMLRDVHPMCEVVFGHKYLEYLSAGLPVLTTSVAKWTAELDRNGFGIVLKDIDDDEAIIRKFEEFEPNDAARERLAQWAIKKFDPKPQVDQYMEILCSLG